MKSCINSIVISCSVLAASVSLAAAQDTQPPQNTIVVGAGNDLRCRLEKGLRITKSGESITARLVEPVYAGTTIAIPEGSTIKGHVSSISSAPGRATQILRGDFTPPRTAHVTFDNVILPDGTAVQIHRSGCGPGHWWPWASWCSVCAAHGIPYRGNRAWTREGKAGERFGRTRLHRYGRRGCRGSTAA